MTVDALIIFSGALVALMPFLGFPTSWDTAIFFILGVFVVGLGIAVRRQKVKMGFARPEKRPELFAESQPAQVGSPDRPASTSHQRGEQASRPQHSHSDLLSERHDQSAN